MISQGYLSRIFRDQFGISTMEYIRLRKIQMVKINFIFTTHNTSDAVSYTHLDVYKRQTLMFLI